MKWKTKVHKFGRAVLSDLYHLIHNISHIKKITKKPVQRCKDVVPTKTSAV